MLSPAIFKRFLPLQHDPRARGIDIAKRVAGRLDKTRIKSAEIRPGIRPRVGIFVEYLESPNARRRFWFSVSHG